MSREKLIQNIFKAFDGVTLGNGIGLWEAQGHDDRLSPEECRKLRKKDEKLDWKKVPVEDLYRCSSSLSFFDAEGMRFYFPIFLLLQLNYFPKDDDFENRIRDCFEADLMFDLEYAINNPYTARQFALFNEQQLQIILDFIQLKMQEFETDYRKMSQQYGAMPEGFRNEKPYIKLQKIRLFWKDFITTTD